MYKPVHQRHERVVIVGAGNSLDNFDFNLLDDFNGAVIATNLTYQQLPRTDYWVSIDFSNLPPQQERIRDVNAYCFSAEREDYKIPVKHTHKLLKVPSSELQEEKNKIATVDSIFACFNIAYHMEAKEIILLGIDMFGGYFFNKDLKYDGSTEYLNNIQKAYKRSIPKLEKRGIRVINGSTISLLEAFEKTTPEKAIQ